jgi:hypothetical protein
MPALSAVPDDHFEGNLWIQELVEGLHLRFSVGSGGYVTFADRERDLDEPPPLRYRAAVDHVRRGLDLERLLAETDPGTHTFFGVATVRGTLPYDLARMPPFLGFDVWDGSQERWLAADTVARVFEGLGLDPVNTFERELPARHFYPDRWETPDSAWYDGPPAGVVVRDKHGNRARRYHPALDPEGDGVERHPEPAALAAEMVTSERIGRVATALGEGEGDYDAFDFETLHGAVVASVFRETRWTLEDGEAMRAFRSAAAERVQRWLADQRI